MDFKISFEQAKHKRTVDNTIKVCNKVCELVAENKDISVDKIKKRITAFIESEKIEQKETDSAAINTRIKECKNGDVKHRDWYRVKSVFTFYNKDTLKIPKVGYVKLNNPTGYEKQMVSNDETSSIKVIRLEKTKYVVEIDEGLIVESEDAITSSDNHEWDKLYQYVKKEIMNYKEEDALPGYAVLRLKGMAEGKVIANRSIKSTASYTYEQILMTFKFCKLDIQEIERRKKFKSEQQRWNYISKIVENKIIEVVRRMDYIAEQERVFNQKSEYIDIGSNPDISSRYIKKTKKLNPKSRLNDLW